MNLPLRSEEAASNGRARDICGLEPWTWGFKCPHYCQSTVWLPLGLERSELQNPGALKTWNKSKIALQLHPNPEAIIWASPDKCRAGRVGLWPYPQLTHPFLPSSAFPTHLYQLRVRPKETDLEGKNPTTSWAQDYCQTLDNLPIVHPPRLGASHSLDLV